MPTDNGPTPSVASQVPGSELKRRKVVLTEALAPFLVGAEGAAKSCSVSVATWHRWNSAGRCPAPVRIGAGTVRWRLDELREWIRVGCPDRRTWEAMQQAINRLPGVRA
jgi:predicted DNA-binding transcriptional regulator AlpA